LGRTIVRFTNREVFNQCEAVLQHIAEKCERVVKGAAV
jgi:very-short-patch-repair endonuclease